MLNAIPFLSCATETLQHHRCSCLQLAVAYVTLRCPPAGNPYLIVAQAAGQLKQALLLAMSFFRRQPETQLTALTCRQLRQRRDHMAARNPAVLGPLARTARLDGAVGVEFDRDDPIQRRTRIAAHNRYVSVSCLFWTDNPHVHPSAFGL
jgi:hypothetical protein